jgi:hypothetical protein
MPGTSCVSNNYSSSRYSDVSDDDDQLSCTDSGAPPSDVAETNAERTSSRPGGSGYAEYGVTSGGEHYAGAAALKGRDPTRLELEVLSASIPEGRQNEVQLGMARIGGSTSGGALSGSVDVFTAKANAGHHNSDGSHGFNLGAVATAVGAEVTLSPFDWLSLTGGASFGVGGEVSIEP